MAKNRWKALAALAVALLLGLGLGALICYAALEPSSALDQTGSGPRKEPPCWAGIKPGGHTPNRGT